LRALATVLVLAAALPASASAFSKAIWGPVTRDGVNQFPLYHQLGVSIYETNLSWSEVAPARPAHAGDPSDPAYQWPASIDQAIAQASRYHMRVMIQLINAPAWANGGHEDPIWAPRKPADFGAFAAAAARRYPAVHLWMIWGEPTRSGNFEPIAKDVAPYRRLTAAQQTGPHVYAQILDAAYGALKRLSRANEVIGGCTFTRGLIDPLQWIANLRLPNGKPPRMDIYAHNPFSYQDPTFSSTFSDFDMVQFSDLPELARWVDRYLRRGMPLFLSEWTIPTAADNEFNFYVDPPVAGRWVAEALRESRRWHRIAAVGWVNVYDDPPQTYGGLLTASGRQKPSFTAFARG
jgi:hypothetical protein